MTTPKRKKKTKAKIKAKSIPSKYWLYENSVQDAADDADILAQLFKRLRKREPLSFREDFCGTFKIACEWVRRSKKHSALGLDIDPEPLQYGFETHYESLTPDQKKRMKVLKQDVNSVTKPGSDLIAACNFSYWIFKTREELIRYFRFVKDSLKTDGLFFMDHVGGYEMVQETVDKETYGKGKNKFIYYWKQEAFNPVNNEGRFTISFKWNDGTKLKDVFTYDWRVWSIREIRECLEEAGFKKSWVFWEQDDEDGDGGNGEFELTESEENCPVFIDYIVASKS